MPILIGCVPTGFRAEQRLADPSAREIAIGTLNSSASLLAFTPLTGAASNRRRAIVHRRNYIRKTERSSRLKAGLLRASRAIQKGASKDKAVK